MNDRPDAAELLEAVSRFLAKDVMPALDGKLKYNARVAAHVVDMVRRELDLEEDQLRAEWLGLDQLEGESHPMPDGRAGLRSEILRRTVDLSERIRAGDADAGPWRRDLISHLRRTVADKLAVARGEAGSR